MRECVNNNWGVVDYQKKIAYPIKEFGRFFPDIAANP